MRYVACDQRTEAAQALDDFQAQQARLKDLARVAGPCAKQTLSDASQEGQLHSDLARALSAGLGLGSAH